MRVQRNPTVKVEADQNPLGVATDQRLSEVATDQNSIGVEADQNLITTVAETTGRVAAKVSNVIDSLAGAFKSRRKR